MSLILHLATLEQGPVRLAGTLPPAILDLEGEESVRVKGDLTYDLAAEKLGDEIIVRGTLEVPLELECSRSGAFFSTLCRDSSFLRDYSIQENPGSIDLTDDVREAVLLEIPYYPVSPEARGDDYVPPGVGSDDEPPDDDGPGSAWSALDNLNLS